MSKTPTPTRSLGEAQLATFLREADRVLGSTHAVDQTLRGDRLGLSVAIAPTIAGGPDTAEGDARASDRIGEADHAAMHASLSGLPLLRITRADDATKPSHATSPPAPADLSSDFRPLGVLGEGGMGLVLLAHQTTLDREVAVKRTKTKTADASAAASLLGEARIMGALEHPNIVPVHLLARDADGQPVLVMKRIEGTSWRDLLSDPTHPFWDRLQVQSRERVVNNLEILMQVCTAVHFAHSREIIHRDIKPENVMLGAFGEVYLVDWGIATSLANARDRHSVVGTPSFMAPEMLHAPASVSPATDVFLLGATLHYLITGRYRNEGADLNTVLRAISIGAPLVYGEDVPVELQDIARRAMADDPLQRYESAAQLREALRDFLRHRASIAICDDGKRRLAECRLLQSQIGDDHKKVGPKEARRIHQLLTEARFAFDQALREWPDNRVATEARQLAISAELDHELQHDNLDGAQRLLAELRAPTDAQRARIAELIEAKRALAADHDALLALRREYDPSIGLATRTRYVASVILITCLLGVASQVIINHAGGFNYTMMFGASLFLALMAVGLLVVMRRSNHFTMFNRRAGALILVTVLGGLGIRIVCWRLGLATTTSMALEEWFIMVSFVGGGVSLHKSIAWGAIPHILCVPIAVLHPEYALTMFSVGGVFSFVVLGLVWRRQFKETSNV